MVSLLTAQPSADSLAVNSLGTDSSMSAPIGIKRLHGLVNRTALLRAGLVILQRSGFAAVLALSVAGAATAKTTEPLSSSLSTEAPQSTHQVISQAQVGSGEVVDPPAAPSPVPTPFSPVVAGIVDLSEGVNTINSLGELRPLNVETLKGDSAGWLKSVILPLYTSPGGEHWGWIYHGWLIPKGQPYLAIGRDASFAMVRAYKNLYTFPVLEAREDGWFRIQYTQNGSAWVHSSQLNLGDVPLTVEGWEARLQAQNSVYFLKTDETQALRSQPQATANMLSLISANSLIKPLAFDGDWMQVRITRPATTCRPLAGATVTEGWIRWRNVAHESLVWYRPDGDCAQVGN